MRARLRSESHCHAQVCLCFDCSASLSVVGHYRLSEIITGHLEWSSAKHYALGQTCFAGRHPTLPASQFFLLKPV